MFKINVFQAIFQAIGEGNLKKLESYASEGGRINCRISVVRELTFAAVCCVLHYHKRFTPSLALEK